MASSSFNFSVLSRRSFRRFERLYNYRCQIGRNVPSIQRVVSYQFTLSRSSSFICTPSGKDTDIIPLPQCPTRSLVNVMANAIIDGNEIHAQAVRQRQSNEQKFTIPDALAACEHSVRELDYATVRGPVWMALPSYILRGIDRLLPLSRNVRIFMLVIAFERSIMIVCQSDDNIIGVADSHVHSDVHQLNGALLACAPLSQLDQFCIWLAHNVYPESLLFDHQFEISAVEFSGFRRHFRAGGRVQHRRVSVFDFSHGRDYDDPSSSPPSTTSKRSSSLSEIPSSLSSSKYRRIAP